MTDKASIPPNTAPNNLPFPQEGEPTEVFIELAETFEAEAHIYARIAEYFRMRFYALITRGGE